MRILKVSSVVYLAGVLALTLWPNLARTEVPVWAQAIIRTAHSLGIPLTFGVLEATANVIMFVPFGVFGVWLLGDWHEIIHDGNITTGPSLPAIAVQITLLGAALSAAIEVAQLHLPGRVTSIDDLWRNSLGAAIGAAACAIGLSVHRRLASA
ncbi:MAG: VanZ family protein [Cellulomonadaceae bacterium]|nr:VanZ family protein [Cellulomonadaceae bacterium]